MAWRSLLALRATLACSPAAGSLGAATPVKPKEACPAMGFELSVLTDFKTELAHAENELSTAISEQLQQNLAFETVRQVSSSSTRPRPSSSSFQPHVMHVVTR